MNPETVDFLHDLYARCPSESQTVFLTFTAIHPDGDKPTPSRHVLLGNRAALQQVVAA
jgi:hypothetical protein